MSTSRHPTHSFRSGGFTLIEIIIAIVVIAAALTGIFAAIINSTARSADPMIQTQAVIIAETYLEEAMLKAFTDPDGTAEGCGVSRDQWDDVQDYNCLASPTSVTDQTGNTLPGLAAYRISMSVTDQTVAGAAVRRIEARVTHTGIGLNVRVAGLRGNY